MVATLEFNRQIHTGIVLTATGVSRCIEIEGYTVLTPLPIIGQVGIGIAFDIPVIAEACGLGGPGLDEDVEIRVYGRGLVFSTPMLRHLLEEVAVRAYAANGELGAPMVKDFFAPLAGAETLLTSIEGSTMVIGTVPIPLYDLANLWGVIVKLDNPLHRDVIGEALFTEVGLYERILLENSDDIVEALRIFTETLSKRAGLSILKNIMREAYRLDTLSIVADISGKYIAYIYEDLDEAFDASTYLSSRGSVVEAPIVVLGS